VQTQLAGHGQRAIDIVAGDIVAIIAGVIVAVIAIDTALDLHDIATAKVDKCQQVLMSYVFRYMLLSYVLHVCFCLRCMSMS